MDERARKRKLEELEDFDGSDVEGVEKELPKQGLKLPQNKKTKKQKLSNDASASAKAEDAPRKQKLTKSEKKQLKKEGLEAKKAKKSDGKPKVTKAVFELEEEEETLAQDEITADANDEEQQEDLPNGEMGEFEAAGLEEIANEKNASASPSPSPPSPTFDNGIELSANTSTSSVIPPATAPKHIKLPSDPEVLRAKLAAKLAAMRAARKADKPSNRQELLESRRKKEDQRRAHKKELRNKARQEEDARREVALASARDSPASSMMSPIIHSPEHNFSFGRVAFADGQTLTDDLSKLRDAPKKRGPQDAATALAATEKKRLRIAGLDDEKRADIEEKDLWLNAKKRAHGEKVRDDTSLLKKTLKRKEKMKKKSEKEWGERKEGVAKSQAMKQKKREENLKKRRDEKGSKGKGKSVKSKKPKVKSRPGFEGSFGSGKRK